MVGLPDASVRESRDRVRSAIRNSGFEFPPHRVTVNLGAGGHPQGGLLVRPADCAGHPCGDGSRQAAGHRRHRCCSASSRSTAAFSRRAACCRLPPRRDAIVSPASCCPVRNAAEASVVEGLRLLSGPLAHRSGRRAERPEAFVPALPDPEPAAEDPLARCRTGLRRRPRAGAGPPRARDRRRRRAQRADDRSARRRQDDDGAAGGGDPAAAHVRRGARGHVDSLGRGAAAGRNAACFGSGRSARRTTRSRMSRSLAAGRFRGQARSASRTTACCSSTRWPSSAGARSKCCGSRSRKASSASREPRGPLSFPARFMLIGAMNPCPCGYRRRSRSGVPVHAGARVALRVATLRTASRSHRPDGRRRGGARRTSCNRDRPGGIVRRDPRAGRGRARASTPEVWRAERAAPGACAARARARLPRTRGRSSRRPWPDSR